jgi:hypothetical protein
MTGIVTASWIAAIMLGSDMRATPPSARMSLGTRSSAITATAPEASATRACSASTTSMMTPPLSISARPVFSLNVAGSLTRPMLERRLGKPPPGGHTIAFWAPNVDGSHPWRVETDVRREVGAYFSLKARMRSLNAPLSRA